MLLPILQQAIITKETARPTAPRNLLTIAELRKTQRLQQRLIITIAALKTIQALRPLILTKVVHIHHQKETRLVTAVGIHHLVAAVSQIQQQLLTQSAKRKKWKIMQVSTLLQEGALVA